ncbi:FadR/GntR family transcriptional regulator [Desnuesiella massiliensis]|uniref:FadR/GntR family transcriptional regulator n=1 Tax=Desnuesiella massiliensis TaxID=1650662 RepID=UPI0006E20DA1|nr:FadR/GntR family transcriptional regulator [Desnuesiella massiliensis]
MDFKTVKSVNLSDQVAQDIIMMVEKGELKPGDKLPTETVLAEKLGISRGILREALMILQYKGYISRKPKDGTYIRELPESNSINDSLINSFKQATYKDLIEMREALEQKIVELAVKNATDRDIEEVEAFLESIDSNGEKNSMSDHDFHLRLAQLSKNILLTNFIDIYYDLICELGESSFKNNEKRKAEVLEEHKKIISAIKARNVEEAKKEILRHLNMVKKSLDSITMNKSIDLK